MSPIPLKDAVRAHMEERQLSDAQWAELERMQQPPGSSRRSLLLGGLAAAAAVVLGVVSWPAATDPLADAIAAEVVRNHIKLKPLEVESSRMADIRAFFVELDFVPIDSELVARAGVELLGGRYCSIQGVQAAQLRVRDPLDDEVHSVYMAHSDDRFGALPDVSGGDEPWVVYNSGLRVQIWREQDVVLAMTRSP